MEFGRAFNYSFQDPDWLKKVGIAAAVCLIPVIGSIVLMGWGLEITRRIISNETEILPDWSDFSSFLTKGFQAFVVSLAYALPIILISLCNQITAIGLSTAASASDSNVISNVAVGVSICLSCLVFIFSIATGLLVPAANGMLVSSGELGAAFRFNEVIGLVRAAPGPYIMSMIVMGLAAVVLVPLGMLACGIGMFFSVAYITTVNSHLIGQAYKVARAAQSAAPSL